MKLVKEHDVFSGGSLTRLATEAYAAAHGGPPVIPPPFPGATIFHKADEITGWVDGDSLPRWSNLLDGVHDMRVPYFDRNTFPILKTAGGPNSKKYVHFTNTNNCHMLSSPKGVLVSTTTLTAVMAFRIHAALSSFARVFGGLGVDGNNDNNNVPSFAVDDRGTGNFGFERNGGVGPVIAKPALNTWAILSLVVDATGHARMRMNGGAEVSAGTSGNFNIDRFVLAGSYNGGLTGTAAIDVLEYSAGPVELSNTDLLAYIASLQAFYGI